MINFIKKILAADLISKLCQVFLTLLLIRILSKNDYATYAGVLAWSMLAASITSGLNISLLRKVAKYGISNLSLFYSTMLIAFSSISFIVLFILFSYNSTNVFLVAILSVSLIGLQLIASFLQAKKDVVFYAITSSIKSLIPFLLICILYLIYNHVTVENYIYILFFSFLFILFAFIVKQRKEGVGVGVTRGLFRGFNIAENIHLFLYYSIIAIYTQMDIIYASYNLDSDVTSEYAVIFRFYSLSILLVPSIVSSLRVYTANIEKMSDLLFVNEKFPQKLIFISLLISILFAIVSPFLVNLAGEQYANGFRYIAWFSIATFFSYIGCISTSIFISLKLHGYLIFFAISSVLFKVMFYLLISPDEVLELVYTFVSSAVFYNITGLSLLIFYMRSER